MNQKCLVNIALIVLVIAIASVTGYFVFVQTPQPINQQSPASQLPPLTTTQNSSTQTPQIQQNETTNWGVYRSENYGIEFKHPTGWYIWDGGDAGISIYELRVGPDLPGVSRSMQIYRHTNETTGVRTYAKQNTPNYSTDSDADDVVLLKKEQGYITVNEIQSYQVYTKTIDRAGPPGCSDPPCDWSAYKNVETLIVRTYIPHKSNIFSVSVYMTGEKGSDEQKKKIDPTEEADYLNIYKLILSTFKFLD